MDNCGGGVGLLYNKCYKIEKQDVTSFLSFEYMEVLLRTPAAVLRIGVLYRPPPSTENGLTAIMFFNEFPILLERLAVASGYLLLTGDFNFHVDDRTDSLASRFLDLLDSHNLIQHVSGPTYKDNHTLDLLITRACEDIIESWSTLNPHLSYHSHYHLPGHVHQKLKNNIGKFVVLIQLNFVTMSWLPHFSPHLHAM